MLEYVRNLDKKTAIGNSIVSYRSLPSYFMPMHYHDALQILIPLEGAYFEISWVDEDKTIESKPLGASDICIIPPFLEHEVRWSNIANFINLYICPQYIDQCVTGGYDSKSQIINMMFGIKDPMLYHLAQTIRDYFLASCEAVNVKFLEGALTVVSQHVIMHYVQDPIEKKILFNSYEQLPNDKIKQAILYIQNNLETNLTIEEIANHIYMSPYHFMRTFKENTGIPPLKFHMMQRIEKAKEKLLRQQKIIDIALDLGFSSQAHFSNVFTKFVGMTPRKFAVRAQ